MNIEMQGELSQSRVNQWGEQGVALIPTSIAKAVPGKLPTWLRDVAPLSQSADIAELAKPLSMTIPDNDWERVVRFVLAWFAEKKDEIADLKAVDLPEFLDIDFDAVNWSRRTANCLRNQRYDEDLFRLKELTFRQLLEIPNLGNRSALDFAVMLESWAQEAGGSCPENSVQAEIEIGNMTAEIIRASEQSWTEQVSSRDPRFSNHLLVSAGTLHDLIEDTIARNEPVRIKRLISTLLNVQDRVAAIDAMPLETALQDLISSFPRLSEERSKVLSYRFGFQGKAPETLAQVGDRLGVTRERIRQIEKKMLDRLPPQSIYMPQLEKAVKLLENAAPLNAEGAMKLLLDSGVSKINFHPKSIIAACKFCRLDTSLKINKIRGNEMVTAKTDERVARRLYTIARRIAGRSGASDVEEVLDVARAEDLGFEDDRAVKLLHNIKEIEWIDDSWFWIPSIPVERNRLRNVTRRMLSVASPIGVKKLRAGARRVARFRNSSNNWDVRIPPIAIMSAFYARHPDFEIDTEGLVSSVEPLDYKQELGDAERVLVDVIRSTPTSLLDRSAFRRECIKRGMNPNTFEITMTYGAVAEQVDTNIWTLRGLSVDPAQVEAIRTANALKPRQKRVTSYGWTESGEVSVTLRVPELPPPSFVFMTPAGVGRYVSNKEFEIVDPPYIAGRKLKVLEDGTVIGSGAILNRLGADEGDIANFIYNLVKNTVSIEIDSDEASDLC